MRNYREEFDKRVEFIRGILSEAKADGIIFGNSGGKDSALVGVLCKAACENTAGIIMPCGSARNYGEDKSDAEKLAESFNIETRFVDLTETKNNILSAIDSEISDNAALNIAPRLRMTALYAVAMSENRLVAGTGNRSERYMGYFTKYGDGACDFNPIADLTVGEVFGFLNFISASACSENAGKSFPENIIAKAPSAGLFEGQTDEDDMGISYKKIDGFLISGDAALSENERRIIEGYHNRTGHKREMPRMYGE